MRRNNRRAGDILGIEELLDAWMDMMTVATNLENEIARKPVVARPKHEGTMSYVLQLIKVPTSQCMFGCWIQLRMLSKHSQVLSSATSTSRSSKKP